MLALRNIACGMAYRHAVLDHALAVLEIAQGVLVSVLAYFDIVVRVDYHRVTFSFSSSS
jgi:hypothetical protein